MTKSRVTKRRVGLICLTGVIASLGVWLLPVRFKPYRISRDLDDYKILLVEQDSEWGFAADGLVKVRISEAYGLPSGGKRELLGPVRQKWIDKIARSKDRWPVISWQIHYDEWGPSRFTQDDGVEVTQTGSVICLPYSLLALVCAIPLVWQKLKGRRKER